MGALAQFVSWIPEDDLLLKNAIEVKTFVNVVVLLEIFLFFFLHLACLVF